MKIFNVLDYGAVPGTGEKMTAQFQAALDACFLAGGGTVEVPAGDYLLGGIRVRSNTVLHLLENAHLFGTRVPEDYCVLDNDTLEPADKAAYPYATNRWNNALIRIFQAENVTILGEPGSCLNGQNCYDPQGEEGYRGPHGITAYYCRNLVFKGYTVRDSANWAHQIRYSSNIVGEDLHVFAGHDGFHTRACQNVEVRNCEFYTGDDAIAGHGNVNVTVTNCILNTACSAFRFGGQRVRIRRCEATGPGVWPIRNSLPMADRIAGNDGLGQGRRNMLSFFTYFADRSHGEVKADQGDIVIEDCTAKEVDRFLHYNFSGNEVWQCGRPFRNVVFRRCVASDLGMSICAYAPEELPFELSIEDCAFSFAHPVSEFVRAANLKSFRIVRTKVRGVDGPLVRYWGERAPAVEAVEVGGLRMETERATGKFSTRAI